MRLFGSSALLLATLLPHVANAAQPAWTRAWTASMWQANEAQAVPVHDVTLRSAIRVGAGGRALRLRLANDHGGILAIGAATVRLPHQPAVRVTFGGDPHPDMPVGAPLVSDPIPLPVKPFDIVEVSLYLPGPTRLTTVHEVAGQPTQVSPHGDHSAEDFQPVSTSDMRPLIAGLDVLADGKRPIVVAVGDSITDVGSCPNDAVPVCRWGDVLGRRFAKAGMPHVVVTQAISGNRVLAPGTGPSALARLDRDVLAMPGVSHIVLLEGINDIGNSGLIRHGVANPPITATDLIQGYRQFVARAHERGIKVIALTLLPFEGAFYYSPDRDAIRRAVNAWIRTSGTFDAVVDTERVVADPDNPRRIAAGLQSGDNLHPDGRGETRIGEAIDLRLFR
ncbi:SGNH/GDSL hydrolase family protein [uncultured Sphingomonas sp.]|uniref:SGNH/GDSL hydrolase family protein n=1 Tax=uncultured Sphingomonas sp. TaxID=158754 RepID=UPI0025D3F82C|nr:SGNH/GDSL hydrolase family protein [uncultured Sphingomonas sp.]